MLDVLLHNQYEGIGMMPMGFRRLGPAPLSWAEQRVRLAELSRARGGDLDAALDECQQALDAEPGLALAHAVRAFIHGQRGDQARCAADCTEAIRLGLREAEVLFARAVALDYLGRPQEALADCTAALQIDPKHANAHNSRGFIRLRLGQEDEALADFAEAVRLAPEWSLPYLNRAQLYHGRGQFDEALADYDKAIERLEKEAPPKGGGEGVPTLALAHCRRGEARYDQFLEEEAEADFAEARRRDPGMTGGYLGDMWLRRNKPDRALDEFSQAVRLRPRDAGAHVGRGTAHEVLGHLEQAAADYTAALALPPEGDVGYALRAQVRQRQGRLDEALADLSQYARLHPEDPRTYRARAAIHKERGAPAEALADLNTAHRADPENPLFCNSLAWMLATCPDDRLRDGDRAVTLARQACEATGWNNSYCLDTLAAACAETGVFTEAVHWQTQAVNLSPEELNPARQARLEMYQAGRPYRE
jgi:tetratricopeptide (TPR) repeat protein